MLLSVDKLEQGIIARLAVQGGVQAVVLRFVPEIFLVVGCSVEETIGPATDNVWMERQKDYTPHSVCTYTGRTLYRMTVLNTSSTPRRPTNRSLPANAVSTTF
eukprot:4010416-Amphidinium_carterae.1